MSDLHPVTQQLQSLFDSTSLDSQAVEICKQSVDEYLTKVIFYKNDDFVETLNALYALNDKKTYSILQLGTDASYTYFLMPSQQGLRYAAFHSACRYLKKSGKYHGEVLGVELSKVHLLAEAIVFEVTKNLTYMKRSATGIKDEVEVEYPPFEKLKLFYECERKMPYASLSAAEAGVLEANGVYLCSHCRKYHQGRNPNDIYELNSDAYLNRYQRVWRWSHNLGEFRHKAEKVSNSEL
jgi:hypothetical protein